MWDRLDYFFYFLLTWLPLYLVREQKIPLGEMTRITAAMFLLVAGSTVAAGWISDGLIARGVSPTRVRRSIVVGGLSVASILAVFGFTKSLGLSFAVLAVAAFGYGVFASNHWAIAQTLSGPRMAGRWTSVQNGIGNLSGIAAPWGRRFRRPEPRVFPNRISRLRAGRIGRSLHMGFHGAAGRAGEVGERSVCDENSEKHLSPGLLRLPPSPDGLAAGHT
jgi:hypothetical protein